MPPAGAPLVTQRISDIEVSRRLRLFLANRLIALGWALKGSCKACAHRLFTTARWLVPEAQRFLVHHTGSHNRSRRIFEFAGDLGTLLSRIQPLGVAAGFLIVLVLLGSLDLATRATAIGILRFSMSPKSHQKIRSSASANFRNRRRDLFQNPLPSQEGKANQFHYLQENLRGSTKSRTGKERKQTEPLKKEWLNKKARGRSRCAKRRRELPFPLADLLGHHGVYFALLMSENEEIESNVRYGSKADHCSDIPLRPICANSGRSLTSKTWNGLLRSDRWDP